MALVRVHTTCNRDCPDACGMIADVEGDRIVALRGDPQHPITRGFLCYRTSRFLDRQYHPDRLKKPLLRVKGKQVEIPLDEALDLAAERLTAIRQESGPGAILHYRSGGSLGLMKHLSDHFFDCFGPVAKKVGDICSGGGDAAQLMDFGREDSNDIFDLKNSKHIINWGKNLHVSNLHLIPIIKEARARGTQVIGIDPVRTRSAALADVFLPIAPDGDIALALAVAQRLFERNLVSPEARAQADHLEAFRDLAFSRPFDAWLKECDLPESAVEHVVGALADGPTAILVGWGLQRRLRGASTVRLLDALSLLSGNLARPGGGVSFYFKRKGAFRTDFLSDRAPPRTFNEPTLGHDILTQTPRLRAIWVTAGNPVAMLPDSRAVARAFEETEFTVVVDAFPTDTTRRATLVLPTTTLLEDDDLIGAYGHHYVGVSRPVVPAPQGVLTDFEILQAIAQRVGLEREMAGTTREWKTRFLSRASERGVTLEKLESGPMKNPFAASVLFADGRFETETGRAQLIHALPVAPQDDDAAAFPLHLFSNSTEKAQSSQWAIDMDGPIPATVNPLAAPGFVEGEVVNVESVLGSLEARLVFDAALRADLLVIPKGGHFDRGWAANSLIRARETDHGGGAAYLSERVRITRRSARP